MRKKVLAAAALAVSAWACHQVILTAPEGAAMTLFANPTFICANGCSSTISAILIEANTNTPVADGTVVQFFTSLGRIDEQGKTNDGVARVNLVSDGRSGVAAITAFSGATTATLGGSGGTVPTPAPSGSPTPAPQTEGGEGVTIGNPNATRILVTADPPRIRPQDARITRITATALDGSGNSAPQVPLFLSLAPNDGAAAEEEAETASPQFTDTSGRAEFVIRTRRDREATQKSITVTVTSANGASGTVIVFIN